jgi:hypothetical protein
MKFIVLSLTTLVLLLTGCGHNPVYSDPQGHFTVEITGDWWERTNTVVSEIGSEKSDEFVLSVGAIREKTEAMFFVKTWENPFFTGGSGAGLQLLIWAKAWLRNDQTVVDHGDIVLVEGERGLFVEVETTFATTTAIRRFYAPKRGMMIEAVCAAKTRQWSYSLPHCTDILDTVVVNR